MLNFTAMIQGIDTIFTNFIFIPALLILYLKFRLQIMLKRNASSATAELLFHF